MKDQILLRAADDEIQRTFDLYEDLQPGRGNVFLGYLDAAFASLRTHPDIAPSYAGPYRRWLLRDFPYGVFYVVDPTRIVVIAITDLRQNPATIRRRLSGF